MLNVKEKIRQFVPPIVWAALSRSKCKLLSTSGRPRRRFSEFMSSQSFLVPFIKVTQDRGTYFVPKFAEHRPASKAIIAGAVYEPDTHYLIDKIFQHKTGSMVHAGTFFGDMLPTFAHSCLGTVYAFEPVLENFILAKLCIEENNLENVHIQNAGLSDSISIAKINTGNEDKKHRGGSSTISETGQLISLVTIDSLGLDDVAIIQLDVEGHELFALKGARHTIERSAPIIMIEDNRHTCEGFLEEMGYSLGGMIPGLFIWTRPPDRTLVESILSAK